MDRHVSFEASLTAARTPSRPVRRFRLRKHCKDQSSTARARQSLEAEVDSGWRTHQLPGLARARGIESRCSAQINKLALNGNNARLEDIAPGVQLPLDEEPDNFDAERQECLHSENGVSLLTRFASRLRQAPLFHAKQSLVGLFLAVCNVICDGLDLLGDELWAGFDESVDPSCLHSQVDRQIRLGDKAGGCMIPPSHIIEGSNSKCFSDPAYRPEGPNPVQALHERSELALSNCEYARKQSSSTAPPLVFTETSPPKLSTHELSRTVPPLCEFPKALNLQEEDVLNVGEPELLNADKDRPAHVPAPHVSLLFEECKEHLPVPRMRERAVDKSTQTTAESGSLMDVISSQVEAEDTTRKVSFAEILRISGSGPYLQDGLGAVAHTPLQAEHEPKIKTVQDLLSQPFYPDVDRQGAIRSPLGQVAERRKGVRGSFELDDVSNSWVPQIKKVGPALSTASEGIDSATVFRSRTTTTEGIEHCTRQELRDCLKISPVATKRQSAQQAVRRRSSSQRLIILRPTASEQEQREDSSCRVSFQQDEANHGSSRLKRELGVTDEKARIENVLPAAIAISSLGRPFCGMPRSPAPKLRRGSSDTIILHCRE